MSIGTKFFISLTILVAISGFAQEDEISPETLPDEMPSADSMVIHTPTESEAKGTPDVMSQQKTVETHPEDSDLGKPITPLLPQESGDDNASKLKALKAQIDAELAKPDPNYVPPQKSDDEEMETQPPSPSQNPPIKAQINPSLPPKQSPDPSQTEKMNSVKVGNKETESETKETTENSVENELAKCKDPRDPNRVVLCSAPNWMPPKIYTYVPLVLSPRLLAEITSDPSHPIPYQTYITKLSVPPTTPSRPPRGVSDISIILSNGEFYPSKIVLKSGSSFRLLFTTTNRRSAALVIEKLNIQRWVASQFDGEKKKDLDRSTFEVNRELSFNRVTEVSFDPKPGTYNFHDVITGASGEIVVEE